MGLRGRPVAFVKTIIDYFSIILYVLLTPHIGWKVNEVLHEFVEIAADQLAAWLNRRLSIAEVLNPEAASFHGERMGGLALNSGKG